MLLVMLLVAGGFWLARHIRADTKLEDCLLAGRRNCVPISSDGTVQPPK